MAAHIPNGVTATRIPNSVMAAHIPNGVMATRIPNSVMAGLGPATHVFLVCALQIMGGWVRVGHDGEGMTGLTLYPAIDLKDGKCVRLRRGEMDQATVYADDPGAQAKTWQEAGFAWLHVVDLNGAFAGKPVNAAAVRSILAAVTIPVQLGGGIRDIPGIAAWLDAGIHRVILGSAAAKNPPLVLEACKAFPGRIAVGIDARDGFVATEGWAETSTMPAAELGLRFEDAGVSAIIYTDIGRDGMLSGLNLDQTVALSNRLTTPVIASGGVGSLAHLAALKQAAKATRIEGVIVGRALYDGRVDPVEALVLLSA